MTSVGYATLDVIPSFRGLQRELDNGTAGPLRSAGTKGGVLFGDAAGKAGGSRFGQVFKRFAQAGLVGLAAAGAGAIKLGMDSVSAASDLEESTNKVSQVFGSAADSVLKFTSTTADALGQTNNQAREAAATFGIFGSAAGLADRKNAKFAKRMTTLASDLASFNNTDPEQAVQALGAALRGESEPIRAYGVMLDEATLKAEALALGILKPVKDQSKIFAYQTRITDLQNTYNEAVAEHGKKSLEALKAEANLGTARTALQKATEGTIPPLTQQQKLLAAQSQIFKQTEVAQGDFARTSDGLANQQRRLAARFEDAKARLGKGLLPIMTDAADFLLDKGIPAFERFADWFSKDGIPAMKKFGDKAEIVAGKVQTLVGWLKDLPDPAKYAGLAALLGGGAALKLRGGKGGALGTAGSVLGIAKGAPVYVTNWAQINGGDGLGPGGGKGGALKSLAIKGGVSIAIAGAATIGIKEISDALAGKETDKGRFGTPGGNNSPLIDGIDLDRTAADKAKEKAKEVVELTRKVDVFRDSLFLAGSTKVEPRFGTPGLKEANDALATFIGQKIAAGEPVTPYINTTSIERALALLRTMNAEIRADALPTRGVDNGTTFQHGGVNPRAGVSINIENMQPHDYADFQRQTQRKLQQSGLGGRP